MFGRHVHVLGNLKAFIAEAAPKLFKKKVLGYALVGLGVLIPGITTAWAVCYEEIGSTTDWTPLFSDENTGWQSFGGVFYQVKIDGSYADNFQMRYMLPATGYSIKNEGTEIVVSDEDVGIKYCPANTWITSIRTSGRYSDNMHFKCSEVWKGVTRLKHSGGGAWGPYSDEADRNQFLCPQHSAIRGIGCADPYCDNLMFYCSFFVATP